MLQPHSDFVARPFPGAVKHCSEHDPVVGFYPHGRPGGEGLIEDQLHIYPDERKDLAAYGRTRAPERRHLR